MRIHRITIVVFLVVMALTLTTAQFAYGQNPDVRRDLASALRVLRPLVRDDPQRAIKMLEALNEEYPTNSQILVLLGEAHRVAGDTEAARAAYQKCLEFHPTHLQSGAALGLLYVQDNDLEQAEKTFDDLINQTKQGVNTYRTIGSTLSRNGYVDLALRYYEEGRAQNNNNYIITLDIAYLFRTIGNYKQSLIEYLRVIEASPKQQRLVKARVSDLLRDKEANQDELVAVLEAEIERQVPHRGLVMEILATTYLERGMLESALDMAILADQETNTNGVVLFRLAELSVKEYRRQPPFESNAYFDLSLRALEAFLTSHPDSQQVPSAKLMLIELLVDLASGRVRAQASTDLASAVPRALDALDWLIESFPGTDYAEQAYLRKGDLILRVQKDPKKALEVYKRGMSTARFYRTMFAERLGRVYLIIEDYEEAQKHFEQLVKSNNEELRDTGIFYGALMLTFVREYESARDTLTSLAEQNPSSQFANDALELAWVIEEGLQGDQRVLNSYTRALQSELADDSTRVIAEFRRVSASTVDTPLRRRGLIRLGEFYQAQGKYDAALESYQTFIRDYPEDGQIAETHRKIGQLYEKGYRNMELALETFESILIAYPYYIFLDEVRDDVTRIRTLIEEN